MRILLTNDDGVNSPGIRALFDELSGEHDVTIVAPMRTQNASSHSLTLRNPLKIKKISKKIIGVYGTPTDCVILAIYNLLDDLPELLLSGVNLGPNLGDDVTYSGTVGAAIEGANIGIPSVSLSFYEPKNPDFKSTIMFILKLIKIIEKNKRIFSDMLLNVNIPHSPRGVRITKLGRREYENVVEEGKKGYLIGGDRKELIEAGTDFEACKKGYISVTPLLTDLTHYEAIKALKSWKF